MRENREMLTIKQLVQDDRYEIDPYLVADAILRRVRMRQSAQNECSKPDSPSSESTKQTPGSPSATSPIQVRPATS
jgi:hypothetical protein